MKPREAPLRAPDKLGYLTVPVPGRDPHTFRLPTWSEGKRLAEYLRARPGWVTRTVEHEGKTLTGRQAPESLDVEYAALLIGVAWHHVAQALEAVYPLDDPTAPNLLRYAQAVERELEEAGYHHEEVAHLGGAIAEAMTARQARRDSAMTEATKLSDFSVPPQASTSSP